MELFIPSQDFEVLLEKLRAPGVSEETSFYASNAKGEFISSATGQTGGATNAVTWGAFPGKEIVTPTIIEEVSFRAWAEEAFGIWGEWRPRVYGWQGYRRWEGKKEQRSNRKRDERCVADQYYTSWVPGGGGVVEVVE